MFAQNPANPAPVYIKDQQRNRIGKGSIRAIVHVTIATTNVVLWEDCKERTASGELFTNNSDTTPTEGTTTTGMDNGSAEASSEARTRSRV